MLLLRVQWSASKSSDRAGDMIARWDFERLIRWTGTAPQDQPLQDCQTHMDYKAIQTRRGLSQGKRPRTRTSWPLLRDLKPLLCPDLLEQIRIPLFTHIRMTLDPIHERSLPQMSPTTFDKRKLHIIHSSSMLRNNGFPQVPHFIRNSHTLERGIVADPLEERY